MEIKKIGIIYEIDANNFLADGSVYINKNINKKEPLNFASKILASMSFENMTLKAISDSTNMNEFKDEKYYSNELMNFFQQNNKNILDVIFFPETGVKGTHKISLNDTAILYLSLEGNIKLGFFINKTVAKILFNGDAND